MRHETVITGHGIVVKLHEMQVKAHEALAVFRCKVQLISNMTTGTKTMQNESQQF